jgi:hypothetical protein
MAESGKFEPLVLLGELNDALTKQIMKISLGV